MMQFAKKGPSVDRRKFNTSLPKKRKLSTPNDVPSVIVSSLDFCTPPAVFACDECNLKFTRAVRLKVHKRTFHLEEFPHVCSTQDCTEKFVSTKLLNLHLNEHRKKRNSDHSYKEKKISKDTTKNTSKKVISIVERVGCPVNKEDAGIQPQLEIVQKMNQKDEDAFLFCLPALNLSESDSSEESDSGSSHKKRTLDKTELVLENNVPPYSQLVYAEEKPKLNDDKHSEQKNFDIKLKYKTPPLVAIRKHVCESDHCYSSDEESTQTIAALRPTLPPELEWRKEDLPSPVTHTPKKELPSTVIPQRMSNYNEPIRLTTPIPDPEPPRFLLNSESMDSSNEENLEIYQPLTPTTSAAAPPPTYLNSGTSTLLNLPARPAAAQQTQEGEVVYCYCRCPYDEVSNMIACDAKGCSIEWFHFDCVGVTVPPKGKWFCPTCRKA